MATIKLASGLTIQTYTPPPRFDFGKASQRERAALGFPLLPKTSSVLRARIEAIVQKCQLSQPSFLPRAVRRPRVRRFMLQHAVETQDIWAGGIILPFAGDTMTWVAGNWTVPSVTPPAGSQDGTSYAISTWVGMDGDDGSSDVLQVGCDATVTLSNGIPQQQCKAWIEWFPLDSQFIGNMPVSSGDLLECVVRLQAGSNNSATILFCNRTKNHAQNFSIVAQQGTALSGNCAEWIVESNTSLGPPPTYQPVTFTNCNAGTAQGATINVGSGNLLNMTDADDQV